MLAKIGQRTKASRLIVHKLFSDVIISVENNRVINAEGPYQQAIDTCSSRIRIFLTFF